MRLCVSFVHFDYLEQMARCWSGKPAVPLLKKQPSVEWSWLDTRLPTLKENINRYPFQRLGARNGGKSTKAEIDVTRSIRVCDSFQTQCCVSLQSYISISMHLYSYYFNNTCPCWVGSFYAIPLNFARWNA